MKPLVFKNINDIDKAFRSEDQVRDYFEDMRWSGSPCCPHCGSVSFYRLPRTKQNQYKCKDCEMRFNCLTDTIFEGTKLSLILWFKAIHLSTTLSKGISSVNMSKMFGITQKTAWFMLHRIREMLGVNEPELLEGIIEADETYIGGSLSNKHVSERSKEGVSALDNKTAVIGMVERGGSICLMPIPFNDAKYILPVVVASVKPKSTVYTDGLEVYKGLKRNYTHDSVAHSLDEYVRGPVHTNTIEGGFSLFKRKINGIHHFVSPKHLHRYCVEFNFSYNHRGTSQYDKFNLALQGACNYRLKYHELIGKPAK